MSSDRSLRGGGRFHVTVTGEPPTVTKSGDPGSVHREALALTHLRGTGLAAELVAETDGSVTWTYVPGAARSPAAVDDADLAALGAYLRRVHDTAHEDVGGRHVWSRPRRGLRGYASGRLADLDPVPDTLRTLADRVAEGLLAVMDDAPAPLRFLHGDLIADNILWTPEPILVDWEFWRTGDPAEDLAYLAVVNGLSDEALAAVLTGYDADDVARRVGAWRPATALDAGLWYLRQRQTEPGERLVALARRRMDDA